MAKNESEPSGKKIRPILSFLPPINKKKGKIVTAEEAIRVIRDNDTIATGGFVGIGFPEELAI